AEGTLMPFAPDPRQLSGAAEVVRQFEAQGYSAEGWTLYSYAAVELFAEAARRAASIELSALIRKLRSGSFETVVGPVEFDAKGDNRNFQYHMYRWHDGKYIDISAP